MVDFKTFEYDTVPLFFDQFQEQSKSQWISAQDNGILYSKDWAVEKPANLPGLDRDLGLSFKHPKKQYKIFSLLEHKAKLDASKPLILQFEMKHQQPLQCMKTQVKLLTETNSLEDKKTAPIVFGVDSCGDTVDRIIFKAAKEDLLTGKYVDFELANPPRTAGNTSLTIMYKLIINSDQTYEINVNNELIKSGLLSEDMESIARELIDDPTDKKPENWDDREMIEDPNAIEPFGDDSWVTPLIPNPSYKGVWSPRKISQSSHLQNGINFDRMDTIKAVGVESWSEEGGIMIDNILLTQDINLSNAFTEQTWKIKREAELIQLQAILDSVMSPAKEAEYIGRQDYDWLDAATIAPEGMYQQAVYSVRSALELFHSNGDEFKRKIALPVFLGCLLAIIVMSIVGELCQRLFGKKSETPIVAKKEPADEPEVEIPGDIQKTVSIQSSIPRPSSFVRRERQFSSPLQFQSSFSAPSSPRDAPGRPSAILEELEEYSN